MWRPSSACSSQNPMRPRARRLCQRQSGTTRSSSSVRVQAHAEGSLETCGALTCLNCWIHHFTKHVGGHKTKCSLYNHLCSGDRVVTRNVWPVPPQSRAISLTSRLCLTWDNRLSGADKIRHRPAPMGQGLHLDCRRHPLRATGDARRHQSSGAIRQTCCPEAQSAH